MPRMIKHSALTIYSSSSESSLSKESRISNVIDSLLKDVCTVTDEATQLCRQVNCAGKFVYFIPHYNVNITLSVDYMYIRLPRDN